LKTNHTERVDVLRQVDGAGRRRVWIACPGCQARVRVIYAPAFRGAFRFLCRTCHGLSYRSRQEYKPEFSRTMDRLFRLEERAAHMSVAQLDAAVSQGQKFKEGMEAITRRLTTRRFIHEQPRRGPGRPSKRALRARRMLAQRARRVAADLAPKRPRGRPKTTRVYVRRQPLELTPPSSDHEAFCVRCRDRRPLKRARTVTLSNGRPALRGQCATCGTRLCRLLPSPMSAA